MSGRAQSAAVHPPVRVQAKLFAAAGAALSSRDLIPAFHRWIQTRALDEVLIDVTDYGHVRHGPGVLLIGLESDYGYDLAEDRPGLVYTRKRAGPSTFEARALDAIRRALHAASLLEKDDALPGSLRFDATELLLRFPDRLHAPNDAETFDALRPALEAVSSRVWDGAPQLLREGDPRAPLTVRARGAARSLDELVARLA